MSEMLMELVGRQCSILDERGEYLTGNADVLCEVEELDDDWIKISYTDGSGRHVHKLDRVDTVESVKIYLS